MQRRQFQALAPSAHPVEDHDQLVLADNLRIHPDVLFSNGNGIFGSGVQGSGKTGILVRILEQASQFHIPMMVFDREGDLLPAVERFPRGVIGTYDNCPSAKDVVKSGLQVIYDLSTWESMDDRGNFLAHMVNSLYKAVDGLPVSHRTPCLIGLDEAAIFLPQRRGEAFSTDTYKAMADSFHNVATTGRKRGLTPVLFTQKISEINKLVLSPGTYIMGRQTLGVDQKRYLEVIEREDVFSYMTERQICQFVSSLTPGRAIVKLADGQQHICQFYPRESVHLSHTPQVQSALNRYSTLPFQPARFGAYIGEEEEPKQESAKKQKTTPAKGKLSIEHPCEKCDVLATHQLSYNVLRATAKGKLTEERYKYFCDKHANKQCKPLERV